MDKQKRWQKYLIFAVILLTVYNILPTIFFYSKPLKKPIDEKRAASISSAIAERANELENESIEWLKSFCDLIKVKLQAIKFNEQDPLHLFLTFKNNQDADKFRNYLPRAGALIPFIPNQLSLADSPLNSDSKSVVVQRKIPIHFSLKTTENYFQFSNKRDPEGNPTPLYRALVFDRAMELGVTLAGTSENATLMQSTLQDPQNTDLVVSVAQNVNSFVGIFGENSEIAKRYFSSFTQADIENKEGLIQEFIRTIERTNDQVKLERIALQSESQSLQTKGQFLDDTKQQKLELLLQKEKTLTTAEAIIKRHVQEFAAGKSPFNYGLFGNLLEETATKMVHKAGLQSISLQNRNPFLSELIIDWTNEKIDLKIQPDLLAFAKKLEEKNQLNMRDKTDQFIYNEIARVSRLIGEQISPLGVGFQIPLNQLQGSKSFLAMRLSQIAKERSRSLREIIINSWHPRHPDLQKNLFPVWDYETYQSLSSEDKKLGLLIYAPVMHNKMPPAGFRMNSIYVVAKGLEKILQKFAAAPKSEQAQLFLQDFSDLKTILQKNGLFGYPGTTYPLAKEYASDFIFEGEDYYQTVLKATRENFTVHGTKRYAVLEFSDVEQRILTLNKIDNHMHEDLLKWRDDYHAAQIGIRGTSPFDIPKPTKNVFWDNIKLSFIKYFRGDDRKILHWGLDLSGGKTVQIELRDSNNRVVTNEADLNQGINELYSRVNKMGVSEVSIRKEGNFITLDFPGSQGLSAEELVKASSMYFHVVNEKFNTMNTTLAELSTRFLQEVWNEAVVTGKKSAEDVNVIAWKHLHGDSPDPEIIQPRSEAAKLLYENGLRLANPLTSSASSIFNDAYSQIAIMRGDDFTQWNGQTNPLMIVFKNYALEGSNLKNVQSSYDPSKGNFLAFEIKGSQNLTSGQKLNPREDLYAWTSQFSKEKLAGTANASYSQGGGWRMAVVLNGTIISAPNLDSPLRDSAMITGSFTQREVNQLEADLKAGSLSFTPRILSEKNVSPELGAHERLLGILAMVISMALVVVLMSGIYRFAGIIASVAVLFNLVIIWATLQNLSATLTLASIAGVILAVGMAVDANVLVFERIREEFAVSGRIAPAIHAGYRKAFSAIFDSNITTIIAALILLNFDSGPIKGLALTLIIGIISSMFTALFMTRYFFAGWVQNPEHKKLNMLPLIKGTKFDFLKYSKLIFIASSVFILIGGVIFTQKNQTIFGMDFTGGYSLNIELQTQSNANYRSLVEKALTKQGASTQEFQIRELTPSNNLRIFLSKKMQQSGHPFFGMPLHKDLKDYTYSFETNPRIVWVVNALQQSGLQLNTDSLKELDQSWNEVSGQLSDAMRNSAAIGLAVALLSILIYITFRFEFKYAISATLCLAHDVAITIGVVALLHWLGCPVQIDLNTVAALMTIVGYSLNDTIIIFDRIREDLRLMRKSTFKEIINHALNVTLSRTMMTSGTTLLVLLPLVLLGGSTVFGFALVMIIGIIFGTLSSLFVAAPLLNYFHERQQRKEGTTTQVIV